MSAPAPASEPAPAVSKDIERLAVEVESLRQRLLSADKMAATRLAKIPAARRPSARNLIHYVALRSQDLRRLQRDLALNGLSSLGRCEAHVLESVERLLVALRAMLGKRNQTTTTTPPVDQRSGPRELAHQARVVFGPSPAARDARIMVTLPSEAASDPELIDKLMGAGMDLARINCAHDDESVWLEMIRLVRESAAAEGRECRILMDLPGPKLRTGPLAGGEAVLHWNPERDRRGRVVAAVRVALVHGAAAATPDAHREVPLTEDFSTVAAVGDQVICRDARGKRRRARVASVAPQVVVIEAEESTYVIPGTTFQLTRSRRRLMQAEVAALPASEEPLVLNTGDTLVVTADQTPGHAARLDDAGQVLEPACIPCSLSEVLAEVKVGEHICFDDGKIDGIIRQADAERIVVEITRAQDGGAKLRADKGINLPDSELTLPSLTPVDRQHLEFAKKHADLIGLSFVHRASDVLDVVEAIGKSRRALAVVLKIETPQAFRDLPDILLAALGRIPMGVMVARGDLAVEIGFARLAEVQEEILWLCEAAHLPVIWGTQVLETLNKKGMATRAEVTDAAMSVRAECVMLNKGPHVVDTVLFLDDVLVRMQAHQAKKRTLLRRLGVTKALGMKPRKSHA